MSMSGQSLGLIETVGLATAIEAADAAIKSANVELLGYESAKGRGMHTVKVVGDVGAVNAAVTAGVAAANRIGKVYAYKVIARTADGLEAIVLSDTHIKAKEVVQPNGKSLEETKSLSVEKVAKTSENRSSGDKASKPSVADTVDPKAVSAKKAIKSTKATPAIKTASTKDKQNTLSESKNSKSKSKPIRK